MAKLLVVENVEDSDSVILGEVRKRSLCFLFTIKIYTQLIVKQSIAFKFFRLWLVCLEQSKTLVYEVYVISDIIPVRILIKAFGGQTLFCSADTSSPG